MRSVETQFYRICSCLAVLLLMGAWQHKFVMNAISANPALNFIIFGTCFFGFTLIFSAIQILRNEFRALYALVEQYDDVKNEDTALAADPYWRFYRCAQIGIIFKKPQILGQSYQLISGQLYREKDLTISAATMQILLDGMDERLNELRSLMSYVAGILIFLGLIGTFLGLMITLASVGDILGGLDLTKGDPTDTISNLMTSLQIPLSGMATGFSSSLFGLITSLTVSLMIQLVARAGGSLKAEFSDWLANIVTLQEGSQEKGEITIDGLPMTAWSGKQGADGRPVDPETAIAGMTQTQFEERRLALLMRAARHAVVSTNRHSRQLGKLTESVNALVRDARVGQEFMYDVADGLQVMIEQNKVIHLTLARTVDAFENVSKSTDVRAEIAELTGLMSSQLEVRDARLTKALRQTYRKVAELSAPSRQKKEQDIIKEGDLLAEEFKQRSIDLNVRQLQKLLELASQVDLAEDGVRVSKQPSEDAKRMVRRGGGAKSGAAGGKI
ncbi:MAG: hypothetical protein AAFX08_04990 [Pseudomonadota bacterium]